MPVRDDVVDCGNHAARRARAVLIEHFENDEVRARRDALKHVARLLAAARDEAGDVRAVAEVVVRQGLAADVVLPLDDAAVEVVAEHDARIDDRDADAAAVDGVGRQVVRAAGRQAERGAQGAEGRVEVFRGVANGPGPVNQRIGRNRDGAVRCQVRDIRAVDVGGNTVNRRMLRSDRGSVFLQSGEDVGFVARRDGDDDVMRAGALKSALDVGLR